MSFIPGLSGTYYLAITRYSGALPGWVQLQAFSQDTLQYYTLTQSIGNPAESANPGLLAVGAAPWYDTSTIEPFSSLGPTRDGRVKPDLVGADRGDSTSYGAGAFAGTSQASPHVAGLAALVLHNFPNTPPTQVAAYLRSTATPRSPANTWGAGFAQLPVFPATISLSAFLSDTTFPAPLGQAIDWRAFAIGAGDPFEYQFWVYQEGVGWTIGQAYGASNTFTWTPMAQGTYGLQVWARSVGSSASYEDWRSSEAFVIAGPAPVNVTALTANVSFPASWGTTITWTATATGGIQPLQYRFWRLKQGVGWTMVQDYGSSNTYTWIPGMFDDGTYLLQVWVRSAGSSANYEGWQSFGFFGVIGVPPVTLTSFSANVTFPSPAYVPITWTAQASGGISPLLYKFWRLKQGVGWTMVQDYGTANTYTWMPTEADAGTYVLQVWVKSSGSSASYDAWGGTGYLVITGPAPVQITGFISDMTLPRPVGTPIVWSASATGGTPPIQFRFWLLDVNAGIWTILQDYSPLASMTWTPTTPGSYVVQVWARSTSSAASYEDWRGTGDFLILPSAVPVVFSFTANVAFPATVTNPITWTASAAGGTAPLHYRFWRLRQGVGWTMVQDYGPSDTFRWTPTSGEDGTYLLQVWVRSAGSTAAYEAWRGTDYFSVVPPTVLRLYSQPGDYIGGGTERLVTPADATFNVTRNFDSGVSLDVSGATTWWSVDFAGPGDMEIAPGVFNNARRFPFQAATEPGLSVSGEGRGCNTLWGRFVVREAVYGSGGAVQNFAADFEQHCEGWAAALFGSIRYNSTVPLVAIQNLTVTGTLPGRIEIPMAWTATGGSGREYQFWRYSQAAQSWSLAQAYSTNPVLIWTPQASDAGSWAIEVWERPVGSSAAYENWRSSGAFSITP